MAATGAAAIASRGIRMRLSTAAASTGRTANANGSILFSLVQISCRHCNDHGKNRNDHEISHWCPPYMYLLFQSILCSKTLVGLVNQIGDEDHDGKDHSQTGEKACAQMSLGDQRADLIDKERDHIAGGKLESNAAPQPLAALDPL